MIKKLKLGLFVALLAVFSVAGLVHAADVNFADDSFVTINGHDYAVLAGSVATAPFVVGTTTLTVTVPSGTFTLVSPDRLDLGASTGVATCDGITNKVVVTGPASVTFTPTGVEACVATSTGGSSGGGSHHVSSSGGGSSSSSSSDDNDNDAATAEGCAAGNLFSTTTGEACGTVVVGCGSGNMFSPITGQSCGVSSSGGSTTTTTTVTVGSSNGAVSTNYDFGTATVKSGSSGAFCRAWQNFFNNKMNAGLVVDGACGPKTMAAARTWQASAGLVADGLLGPMSRAKAYAQAQF